ncbi:anti-phage deoxyguanosine triphosphatase [Paracoccus sp. PS-1]|uniref:anti-phage deoxyguanosine triphosphatase n=1 Tax=unclassified Paracoccus (in: a-proteobacteria) TaxID=2688777 RepID=UPI0004B62C75|nr:MULTISPECIES: anti-phage deoxyguanosine triphosphatase [unclassified Paracoccus (in: a-proteobacteria)]MDQ7261514.1 anti-phage deoxyguanosine triphosphatase [Paracoccus sp. PS1]
MVLDPAWLTRREARRRPADDFRDEGDVDYARVIHSAGFRRLQGKTQILNLGDSDFYRTRLTHSLEVAQIAGGLVQQLQGTFPHHPATAALPGRSMIQAIACAHDLGHPPFGHGGEVALNWCMRDAGGFEGNGQTLRLLAQPADAAPEPGVNLTRRSLLGVLKYPASWSRLQNPALRPRLHDTLSVLRSIDAAASTPPKCHLDGETGVVDWILAPLVPEDRLRFVAVRPRAGGHAATLHKSLDCSIMDVADDIAYGVHDLEDAVALGLVSAEEFRAAVTPELADAFDHGGLMAQLFGPPAARKSCIGALVHHFIGAVRFREEPGFREPLLRHRVELAETPRRLLGALKGFIFDRVIRSAGVQQLEFKGQAMVVEVFEALRSDPERLLPGEWRARFAEAEGESGNGLRIICDCVAAMTDTALLRTYERLFAPRMGSVFDRL